MTAGIGRVDENVVEPAQWQANNRRETVALDAGGEFEPLFKANLWKVKTKGNRMDEQHWLLREMWITKNGNLVYWSKKDDSNVVYRALRNDVSLAIYLVSVYQSKQQSWTLGAM